MESLDSDYKQDDTENSPILNHTSSGFDEELTEDSRTELNFEREETDAEKLKRALIEQALQDPKSDLIVWQKLALDQYGLVGDDLRVKIWPLLMEVDPNPEERTPRLEDLAGHNEYQQVVLDVNRSLKRFPPGIPYDRRVALQDQLTVLILRVIIKYPHLRYYQGYHDVAVTFLLVLGEALAFRIMERLSTDHLHECMEPTMDKTNFRLNYMYALLFKVDRQLHDFIDRSEVGTMFALPWYLTWFGHSLNQYKDVVRLYDFFLATPPMMPIYVATALIVERREEVFAESCDMASLHCLLGQIPDHLNFETILKRAKTYYQDYPPEKLENHVKKRIEKEKAKRLEEVRIRNNRFNRRRTIWSRMYNKVPNWLTYSYRSKYGILIAAAAILLGYYAIYYKKNNLFGITWGQTS